VSEEDWKALLALADSFASGGREASLRDSPELQGLLVRLRGAARTERPDGRGELTHPIVLTRVLAALLEREGAALRPEQWRELADLLEAYEASFAELESLERTPAPRFERHLQETELKSLFANAFLERLDGEQRRLLEELHPGGCGIPPCLSPLAMAEIRVQRLAPGEAAGFREALAADLGRDFGLEPERAEALVARFLREIEPLLDVRRAAALSDLERVLVRRPCPGGGLRRAPARPRNRRARTAPPPGAAGMARPRGRGVRFLVWGVGAEAGGDGRRREVPSFSPFTRVNGGAPDGFPLTSWGTRRPSREARGPRAPHQLGSSRGVSCPSQAQLQGANRSQSTSSAVGSGPQSGWGAAGRVPSRKRQYRM
jgi:hypothetical protein